MNRQIQTASVYAVMYVLECVIVVYAVLGFVSLCFLINCMFACNFYSKNNNLVCLEFVFIL